MKLSIITPYYKTLEYTKILAEHLIPQLNDDVEWIIVDDGCNEKELDKYNTKHSKVYHYAYNNGNASNPRNLGLFYAKGDYIGFIDSDDDVTDNYISTLLEKIEEGFDYCLISWRTNDGYIVKMENNEPPAWNTSVWNRLFSRQIIGRTRFNPVINYGEDKEFLSRLKKGKTISIDEPIYIYNRREGSLTDRYKKNELSYKKQINSDFIKIE
jgi:glycosyltransferase involved in cell wall biosynthesis